MAGLRFRIASRAFIPGGVIRGKHTCDSADLSPPMKWADAQAGIK